MFFISRISILRVCSETLQEIENQCKDKRRKDNDTLRKKMIEDALKKDAIFTLWYEDHWPRGPNFPIHKGLVDVVKIDPIKGVLWLKDDRQFYLQAYMKRWARGYNYITCKT